MRTLKRSIPLLTLTVGCLIAAALPALAADVFQPGKGWQPAPAADSSNPPPDASSDVQYQHALVLYQAGKFQRCRDFCLAMLSRLQTGPPVEQAWVLLVRSQAALRQLDEAQKSVNSFRHKFPDSPFTNQMLDAEMDIVEHKAAAGDYKTFKMLKEIIDANPYGPRSDRAQLLIGHYYMSKHDYLEARLAYQLLLTSYPRSGHRAEAQFGEAKASYLANQGPLRNPGFFLEAREIFNNLIESDPDSRFAVEARSYLKLIDDKLAEHDFGVAQYYEKQHELTAAAISYRDLRRLYPDSPWAKKAADRLHALHLPLTLEPAPESPAPESPPPNPQTPAATEETPHDQ